MSLLEWKKFWQRKQVRQRPPARNTTLRCEPLESRKMLTLLGLVPQFPIIAYDNNGVAAYTASAQTFDVDATPLTFKASIPTPPRTITNPRDVAIHILVDNAGNLIGGTAGDDLKIEGTVDIDGNPSTTADNFSGVLLTGEVLEFGFLEAGVTDQYDFRFVPTDGFLASYWAGKDIGITMNSENSTFSGDFSVDFGGGAKGNIGAINQLPGRIIVDKVTDPAGDPTSFGFTTTGAGYTGFSLADADAPNEQQVAPGTYSVAELVPAGWDLADITIVDPTGDSSSAADTATLVVGSGETIHVTFTDTKRGKIVVDKVTDPAGDPTSFDFATTGAGYAGFSLADADAPNEQELVPGNYTIEELVPAGWDLSGLTIVDPTGDSNDLGGLASLSLAAGETIYVTFTDTKRGKIIVDKITTPSGDPTGFNFETMGLGFASFVLADADAPNEQLLPPGTYTVAELVPPGWTLTGLTVVDPTGDSTTAGSLATLVLAAGETILVTYTDAQVQGGISGTKYFDETGNGLTPDDQPMGGVTIYLDTNNNGVLNAGEPTVLTAPDGTYSFDNLDPGTYVVRELVPTDFVRTAPALADHYVVTLATGQGSTGNDFANAEKCDPELLDVVYIINGTTAVTDLRGNTNEGDTVEVTFTIPEGHGEHQYTFVSYTAPGPTFVAADAWMQEIFDIDTGVFGPGTHTLTVTIPHSFYQIDFVCGAAIDQFGPAGSNIFYSPQKRLISADNDGTHAVLANPSTLSGFVYVDVNGNGDIDLTERAIPGVKVKLTGTSTTGQSISQTSITDVDGMYFFDNLPAGTYTITETQPAGYSDGLDSVGTLGGSNAQNDKFSSISVAAGEDGMSYNFGEQRATGSTIAEGQTATIGFWNSKNGQNLIKSLNGSANSKALGNYLAQLMPNVYGANAGSNNLAGKSNTDVGKFYQSLFKVKGMKLDAQVMAVALATYVTKSSLAGNAAVQYGFTVNANGVGVALVNVGEAGAAFGLDNGTLITVYELLQRANERARKGKLWDLNGNGSFSSAETVLREQANELFDSINNAGDIG